MPEPEPEGLPPSASEGSSEPESSLLPEREGLRSAEGLGRNERGSGGREQNGGSAMRAYRR